MEVRCWQTFNMKARRLRSGFQRNNSPVRSKPTLLIRRDYQGVCPCGGNSGVRD
jgi:hypothetical protein